MDYGLPPEIHSLKVSPWTVRLTVATQALNKALKAKDSRMVVYFLEDTSFWMGRVTCDAIGAAEGAQNFAPYRSAALAVMGAAEAIAKAKGFLTKPSKPLGSVGTTKTRSPGMFYVLAAMLIFSPMLAKVIRP